MKYQRRTDDDRIAELNAKIEGIRVRAARKAARANPAVRQTTIALKAIERAIEAKAEPSLRIVLQQVSVTLRRALEIAVASGTHTEPGPMPKRRARPKAEVTA